MSKQDRQGARTVSDLEQRYGFEKKFSEIMGIASDARSLAEKAQNTNNLTHEQVFNLLTNKGAWQGMYEENGQVYINASYIKSGEFVADLIKAGVLQSVDGETFKLDLDNGTLCLKSGGNVVMDVNKDGAKLSGWDISRDYLGTENAGLNGNIALYNNSVKNNLPSLLRFYAGAHNGTKRMFAELDGMVKMSGFFEAHTMLAYIAANPLNAEILSITVHTPAAYISLTEDDFDERQPLEIGKTAANIITAIGKLKDSAYLGCPMTIQISYDSCIPAFQVLDDGSLIVEHAKIGGYNIADLVSRIEALERKVGS